MTETLANGYSSESTQRELSHEYQHDRDSMFFKKLCVLVLWTKVASALEGLSKSVVCADGVRTLPAVRRVAARSVDAAQGPPVVSWVRGISEEVPCITRPLSTPSPATTITP